MRFLSLFVVAVLACLMFVAVAEAQCAGGCGSAGRGLFGRIQDRRMNRVANRASVREMGRQHGMMQAQRSMQAAPKALPK